MTRYRTIVADPPWHYGAALPPFTGATKPSTVPYGTMSVDEIKAIPVREWAEPDAHLYLWSTNTHLRDAWSVAEAWGFRYSTLLVWCKAPRGINVGIFTGTTEYVLFCRRGSLPAIQRIDRTAWDWPRGEHSAKPEAFLDLVESVSPGPRLEMFSRRARLGWSTWGNESLEGGEAA